MTFSHSAVWVGAIVALWAVQGVSEDFRLEALKDKGIEITAIEWRYTPRIQCQVFYWHPGDTNQDGRINTCLDLQYDPCQPQDAYTQLTRFVLSGGDCSPPDPLQCDGFSPQPPGCP